MINKTSEVIEKMICYYGTDIRRINHFLKVYSFAKSIGELESLDKETQYILELSSIVHDIGIKVCEEKYNSSAGNYQEIEGPSLAEAMLLKLNVESQVINRVCYLVGHHHTYNNIEGIDYQILIESDFLVNIFEDNIESEQVESIKNKYFKTKAGIQFFNNMYL